MLFLVAWSAAGPCARVIWGVAFRGGVVAWLGSCVRALAWAGVVGAAHGLGLGLLVGGVYASSCV